AKKRGLSRIEGHREGVKRVNEMIDAAIEQKLRAVTFYTFSMENWQRPAVEVNALMNILSSFIKSEMKKLNEKEIVFKAIGNIEKLPKGVQKRIKQFEDLTKDNTGVIVTSALSYGGRAEIVDSVKKIIEEGLRIEEIDEKVLGSHLYTVGIPDPDLIIRTSGEMRLSNFLLWQSAYSEFYFTKTLWPDFRRDEFISAIKEFEGRERRFGALPEED
ncbi:MAG TPA: di-trans,poly-cis-decaprenylcistransferase, partial [Nitrospirae bacterium]|nr:di-trans,poly-cis-decaprenylcistransferase [Nitrospirota bacterium]HEW81814.1 di-trans,poly-cis-decaprenylcistransferase [Nitrospirota bacterium]